MTGNPRTATFGETVAALATPPGPGALAVVRVTGPQALELVSSVFRGRRPLQELRGFEGTLGTVWSEEGPVDEVVAWVYRAPRSYTGEPMVELSCHGGAMPARRILDVLWAAGIRPASPGEFTRRAFENGRLDLAQAEAVADLVSARGKRAQDVALAQLQGGLSKRVREAAGGIREALIRIEAHLDFGEDVPESPDRAELLAELRTSARQLEALEATHAPARRFVEGAVIALVGRPNVGKSSLLNALLGSDRALVHAHPGTTRDWVDADVEWKGVPVRLVDTAGLRAAPGPVEQEGIERARNEIKRADRILWIVDAAADPEPEDGDIAGELDWDRTIVVLNKTDLEGAARDAARWVGEHSPRGAFCVSALTGDGVAELKDGVMGPWLRDAMPDRETSWVVNARHAELIRDAETALERAARVLAAGEPWELGAADLHRALDALGAVTGDRAGEDVLDAIFSRFCIGK